MFLLKHRWLVVVLATGLFTTGCGGADDEAADSDSCSDSTDIMLAGSLSAESGISGDVTLSDSAGNPLVTVQSTNNGSFEAALGAETALPIQVAGNSGDQTMNVPVLSGSLGFKTGIISRMVSLICTSGADSEGGDGEDQQQQNLRVHINPVSAYTAALLIDDLATTGLSQEELESAGDELLVSRLGAGVRFHSFAFSDDYRPVAQGDTSGSISAAAVVVRTLSEEGSTPNGVDQLLDDIADGDGIPFLENQIHQVGIAANFIIGGHLAGDTRVLLEEILDTDDENAAVVIQAVDILGSIMEDAKIAAVDAGLSNEAAQLLAVRGIRAALAYIVEVLTAGGALSADELEALANNALNVAIDYIIAGIQNGDITTGNVTSKGQTVGSALESLNATTSLVSAVLTGSALEDAKSNFSDLADGAEMVTVSGTITGLTWNGPTLSLNSVELASLTSGTVSFNAQLPLFDGDTYEITASNVSGGTCEITAGQSGTVTGNSISAVAVTCTAGQYQVLVNVSGLSGSLDLLNNGGDGFTATENGPVAFPTLIADAGTYNVTVDNQPSGQQCYVANGSGIISSAATSDIEIACYGYTVTNIDVYASDESDSGIDIAIHPSNGKIYVSGYGYTGVQYDGVVYRLNSDGSLDTGFGTGGRLVVAAGSSNAVMTIDGNGKIVILTTSGNDLVFKRYTADGAVDSSFNGGSDLTITNTTLSAGGLLNGANYPQQLVTDSANNIYLTLGKISSGGGCAGTKGGIVKVKSDGSGLETAFSGDGLLNITTSVGMGRSILIDNGTLYYAGQDGGCGAFTWKVALVDQTTGTVDSTFTTNFAHPTAATNDNSTTAKQILLYGGKVLAYGTNGVNLFNTDGTDDTTFDAGDGFAPIIQTPGEMAELSDGRFVFAGNYSNDIGVAIYTNDLQSVDTSFASSGLFTLNGVNGAGTTEYLNKITVDNDVLYGVGVSNDGTDSDILFFKMDLDQ